MWVYCPAVMAHELSKKQSMVLEHIARAIEGAGRPPTLREIAMEFGISVSTVRDHLKALQAKGVLSTARKTARGLTVVAKRAAFSPLQLPILGRVAAGEPMEALENVEGHLALDRSLARGASYVLRVKGDSMAPDIQEGDFVWVKQTATAESGELVVAHAQEEDGAAGGEAASGEATIKRLRKRGKEAWLEAINPRYRPIKGPFRVIGKVLGLIRCISR